MTKENIIGSKQERIKRINGSEFATVLGINPYKKRIELVLEKAGVLVDTFKGNEATKRGEFLENEIIARFEDETGLSVTDEQKEFTYTADHCLPLVCHTDGITSDRAVFEAKTTDVNAKTWKNGIPEYYKAQLEFNCALANLKKAYIAVGYCQENEIVKFEYFEYKPTKNIDKIFEECQLFSQEVYRYMNIGVVNNGIIVKTKLSNQIFNELEDINEQISHFKIQLKPLENRKKELEEIIKKEIGINSGIETNLYKITLGNRITSPTNEYKISRSGIKIEYLK